MMPNASIVDRIAAIYDRIEAGRLAPIWISLAPREASLTRARELEGSALPLAGVSFAIKDNIDLAGLPTTAGCPAYAYSPERTATVVTKLIDAGAIPIGKTEPGSVRDWLSRERARRTAPARASTNDRYISGGSSSGSAVAVASGLVDFSLGTDTAGSGRVPAAFNDLVA
jgi:allophanate hydrolase